VQWCNFDGLHKNASAHVSSSAYMQPKALNAVGVHRDQRNHDQSFKGYAATYEEPAFNGRSERYTGGRYIRRVIVR